MTPYTTATAFRCALTDRLRAIAKPRGRWSLGDLQRQFAHDRLLTRLYRLDNGWVVKGATALLAREIAVRRTRDVDLYRATTRRQAEHDARAAAGADLEDWFEFEVGAPTYYAEQVAGTRLPVIGRIGGLEWARFHLDVVSEGIRTTSAPEAVPPLPTVEVPGLARVAYRAQSIVDHVADKVCAILERHRGQPSSRFKDLVDLVVLIGVAKVGFDEQREALLSEADRRGLDLPATFDVPDRDSWQTGYAGEAGRAPAAPARTLAEALALACPFVDPLLDGRQANAWCPDLGVWE